IPPERLEGPCTAALCRRGGGTAALCQHGAVSAAPASGISITPGQIEAACAIIRPHVRLTPILEASGADFGLGAFTVVFKVEHLQHAGSFKARGAFANLLLRDVPPAGVVAASGGNHGVAVAYAASRVGLGGKQVGLGGKQSVPARLFVPTVSAPAQLERIRQLGAELVVTGD